ncbi:hypothetical protein TOPH_07457 [Tolypocladium ophioglossoides CBS 100239]|uniref:Uncharacterized protein n=1 Tax=Tolypocladium ophioglossoides (strain CBS 100239) TaxID=1163406 RepID=A0A0L0N1D0_TOLOC|nr:hypothetical protein TOPH_07457 [Tolypocladium ophioglossoides CBS 100239]
MLCAMRNSSSLRAPVRKATIRSAPPHALWLAVRGGRDAALTEGSSTREVSLFPNCSNPAPCERPGPIIHRQGEEPEYLRRLWKPPPPGILSVLDVYIKVKPFEHLAEAHAMHGKTYIVIRRITGQMAWHGWQNRPKESKKRILHQLRWMMAELRSIPRPEGAGVASVDGGPLCDCRLPKLPWGPFATIRDMRRLRMA